MLAANLIKAEIREHEFNKKTSKPGRNSKLELESTTFASFSERINQLRVEVRIACPMSCQSSKKDTFPPLLFGRGVDLDQTFDSKWLLRHLSRFGLSITPDEVTLYQQSVLEASTAPHCQLCTFSGAQTTLTTT